MPLEELSKHEEGRLKLDIHDKGESAEEEGLFKKNTLKHSEKKEL